MRRTKEQMHQLEIEFMEKARARFKTYLAGRPSNAKEIFLYAFRAGWDARAQALNRNLSK